MSLMSDKEFEEVWPKMADEEGNVHIKIGQLYKFKNIKFRAGGYFYKSEKSISDTDINHVKNRIEESVIIENGTIVLPVSIVSLRSHTIIWFLINGQYYNLLFSKEDYFKFGWSFHFKELLC